MLLPPTALGVTAEVNSHIMHTFSDFHHDKSPSVIVRYRHVMPNSRAAIIAITATAATAVRRFSGTTEKSKLPNSSAKSHTTTAMPINTGNII